MRKLLNVYLDGERYNPRVRATIPGAWVAVLEGGAEVAICREHEAGDKAEARAIYLANNEPREKEPNADNSYEAMLCNHYYEGDN